MSMNKRRHLGFTLIEVIIFIVVVGVGVAVILQALNQASKASADPMVRKQVMALADSIMEEILQKAYCEPDPVTPTNCNIANVVESGRDTYNDVDDYNGLTKAAFTDWPSSLAAYTVTISVGAPASIGTPGVTAKKVTVTVTGGAFAVTLTGYKTQYY